ncbi:MAG: PD-(D/E)XK nuclease family protein [Planctomycetota bacterium]|nr:PD-(D/E)XK nuclease family protein [Planctomycetota bacterium]
MALPIHRQFLGWDAPPLPAAAQALVELGLEYSPRGELDLARTLIVLPGSRASRLLLAELVRLADERGLLLSAPRLLTPGPLQDALLGLADRPRADALLRLSIWADAILRTDRATLAPLIAHPPDTHARAAEFARVLIRAHSELAGHGLRFRDAVDRLGAVPELPPDELPRWTIAAGVQERACATLGAMSLADPEWARLDALSRGACARAYDLVALVGIVDLPALPRRLLSANSARIVSLVAAPAGEAHRFDEFGCVSARAWATPVPGVRPSDDSIVFTGNPAEGAEHAVAAAIRCASRGLSVAIAAVDSGWITPMKRALERSAGPSAPVRVRSAAGVPIAHEPFFQFVSALSAHLIESGLESLRALLTHPDAADALARRAMLAADPLATLDRLTRREVAPELSDVARRHAELAPLIAELTRLRTDILRPQPFHRLASALLNAAIELARELWTERPRRWQEQVRVVVDALRAAIPAECDVAPVPPAEALALLVSEWRGLALPDEPDYAALGGEVPDEIEALGWLESALDPSEALVLAGVSEGRVPTPVPAHPLLTPAVRRALALPTDADLVARDRALLAQMLAPRREVVILAARRDAEGAPLWPSRLLLDDDGPTLAERVTRFVEPRADRGVPLVLTRSLKAGAADRFRIDPARPAAESDESVTSMRVTDFRLYLESPLRFYLARVLKVEEIVPGVRELDALAFGTLVHDALKGFSAGPDRASDRADQIAAALEREVRRLAGERYGTTRSPAVRVQIEFAAQRLRELADWQARRRAQGWEIIETEWSPRTPAALEVDGAPMTITGRIDRIDRGPDGQIAILDYKSGNEVQPPAETHLTKGNAPAWMDLQLPLYTVLARELLPPGAIPALGYIAVPRQRPADSEHLLLAGWGAKHIEDAIDAAREVVRRVRRREFTELGRPVRAEYQPIIAAYLGEKFLAQAATADSESGDDAVAEGGTEGGAS